MKLLLDQGLPLSSKLLLRAPGMECVHVASINLSRSSDHEILETARREQFVIVTLDADFHSLLAVSGAVAPSVIRIRIEVLRAEPLAALVQKLIADHWDSLEKGALLTVGPGRTAVHYLPITRRARGWSA